MVEFAMAHEIICFIIALSLIWAVEASIRSIAERNKPACNCSCCEPEYEDATEER